MFTRVLKAIYNLSADVNQKKTLSYIVVRGFSVISNYIFSILVIQLFSKEDYGTFIYGLSVFMIFSVVFKFGVDVHFVKIFSEYISQLTVLTANCRFNKLQIHAAVKTTGCVNSQLQKHLIRRWSVAFPP